MHTSFSISITLPFMDPCRSSVFLSTKWSFVMLAPNRSVLFKNEIVDDDIEIHFKVECSKFTFPSVSEKNVENSLEYDEDGDIVVRHRVDKISQVAIEHYMETYLNNAGLQIWTGCFLLTDYVMSISSSLWDQYMLELGAGTGLCSIVASMFAKHIFATDGNLEVLCNCQKNITNHEHQSARQGGLAGKVIVRLMDWGHHGHCVNSTESLYGWTEEEKELLKKVSVYLASDVIYDDDVTDKFFKTLVSLMENSVPSTLYLSLEKRVNFILETLSIGSPAYDHFRQHCETVSQKTGKLIWDIQQVEIDFPQFFPYERNTHMELWKFCCQQKVSEEDDQTII